MRIGREHVWIAGALTPAAIRARALLWSVHARRAVPELPRAGRKLMPALAGSPDEFYRAIGYRRVDAFAFRVDAYEALSDAIFAYGRQGGPFALTPQLITLAGDPTLWSVLWRRLAHVLKRQSRLAEPRFTG